MGSFTARSYGRPDVPWDVPEGIGLGKDRDDVMRALLGYDGSPGSEQAAAMVRSMAWPTETTIRVVAALPSQLSQVSPWLGMYDVSPVGFEEQVAAELRSELVDVAERLRSKGRRIEVGVLRGRPADAILQDATTFQADLIVVGTRGHGSITSLVIGSVSAEVVDRSPAPVLVARQPNISRVLFAIDRSPGARDAEDILRTWPVFDDVAIRVVSVDSASSTWTDGVEIESGTPASNDSGDDPAGASTNPRDVAQQCADRLTAAGREADHAHRSGEPAAAIIRAARQWNADLVVLGSSGRSGHRRVLPGSVARHVLHATHASVLIARAAVATKPPRGGRRAEASRVVGHPAFAPPVPSMALTSQQT